MLVLWKCLSDFPNGWSSAPWGKEAFRTGRLTRQTRFVLGDYAGYVRVCIQTFSSIPPPE